MTTVPPEHFDRLYSGGPDPYGFRTRWYERRKHALTLALLARPSYGRALEVGCAEGALTELLAPRCAVLDALDASPVAVDRAAAALSGYPRVRVTCAVVPAGLPAGPYDLAVLSEVGYYLAPADLEATVDRLVRALGPGGELLAVHWRHPSADYPLTGDDVHSRLDGDPRLDRQRLLVEPDVLLAGYRRAG